MSIVLFAIIGAKIGAGLGYWICFVAYCMWKITKFWAKFFNAVSDD